MDDAYPHALLVELAENNIPKLKNKLVKYFQSKKSNGGDCRVEYEDRSGTAVLRFRTEEDRQRVLGKEGHEINLDKGVLKVTVRLPNDEKSPKQEPPSENLNKTSDDAANNKGTGGDGGTPAAVVQTETESRDDEMADDEPCSTSAVLGNIPQSMNREFLDMLVENILKDPDSPTTSKKFSLEVLPDISSAVVTFQSGKENTNFLTSCPSNRMFKSKKLSVQPLEVTAKVIAEDIPDVSKDHLYLYFENEGEDVEDVMRNEEEQSAIITFKDHNAVDRIIKKKLAIEQKPIRVFPFYESLGTALYGKDRPTLKLPAAFSESIDDAIWRYLNAKHEAAAIIHSDLAKHFCKVDLQQSTVCLSPLPALLQQKSVKAKDIQQWTQTVKMAFAQAVSKFKSLQLQPESVAWEESEEKIREALLNEAVAVVADKANGVLSVVGFEDDVNRLKQTVNEIFNRIAKRVQREKLCITDTIDLSPSVFYILCQDGLQDKLLNEYPELKIAYKKESQDLSLTGLNNEVLGASKRVFNGVTALKRRILEIDNSVLEFLMDEDQEDLTSSLLTSKKIDAALEISGKRVQLLAVSDRALNEAEDQLSTLLISQYIAVEDSDVLNKSEWQDLVARLEDANNDSFRKILIQTPDFQTSQQVVVSGYKDSVRTVRNELDDFLQQNAQVEETVVVKPDIIVKYIEKHNRNAWWDQVKDKVEVSFRKEAIYLSGSRVDVTDCKTLFEDLISSVFSNDLKVSKPGAKKFFQEKEAMYVSSVMNDTGCLVQLVDETGGGQDDLALGRVPKPMYQLETPDGVEIAVCKADMCSYPVSVVVNASNQDLKHNGGLAGALLNAAGPQLQDECDKLINSKGQLRPGDCVMTGAGGRLCCKKIIHAVGPSFDQANPQKAVGQLRRAVKGSLELAETHSCLSVALPAISRNLGFPLSLCADTIVEAVKGHCDDKYGDNTLKRIHLVSNDDSTITAMEAAVKKEFGTHGVSHSQQNQPTRLSQTPQVRHVQNPSSSDQVLTKEGLSITLMKGNIQDAATEVIVNTVAEDLVLTRGAVSNAIFGVAGPKLQELVKEKQTNGNLGDVIVTDACKLKSKKVFHAVAPHWDNGQGTAQKILNGIFKNCLGQAEDSGLTSITFPAIGTGNLGFPKDLAASSMLDKILKFSSKRQPKHLKTVVVVLHPSDAQTIQAFTDEFKKRFSTTSGGPVPTTTTQTTGPFSKVTSTSGMHETKMGNVAVQVVTGDITKETTDVIVNSSNNDFSLNAGVSKAILNAAGQAVQTECQTLGAQPNPGMIMTQPGNLKCKKILHLVGQSDPNKINKAVKDALQMCVKDSYTSVSFPAIGTGQGNVQAGQVADAMLDAVVDVLSTPNTLKTIRIVIFQPPMLKDFYNSLQTKAATDAKDKAGFWGNLGSKIKSLFTGVTADKPQKDDFVIDSQEVASACFHICGASQAGVDLAQNWISDLISKELSSDCITDDTILNLTAADHQRIVDIQRTRGVSIRIECQKLKASLTIMGLSKDVLEANNEIHKMLRRARDEEDLKKTVELAGTVADWQYQQQGLQFQSFDPMSNFHLEQALEKEHLHIEVNVQGQVYKVAMPSGPATDIHGQGLTLQIRRIDKLKAESLPQHWDTMPGNAACQALTIQAGTAEYTEVLNLFQATCKRTVIKIERIQNPTLWKSLQIKKQDMEKRNGHQKNERRLFHGTCHSTVAYINQHGFNRSYAGKNAAMFGNGTYFAVTAAYSSHDTYSKPDTQGQKFMYLCRVLTGDFTKGQSGMVVPPAKSSASIQQYDSVVDNPANPSMFIIFHDSLAYPEYLITFK
uniref:poly(ADP-ribose) polymerase family member 14-related sequence 1 n=1 Tax=Centroberyx gerrardi TaxID=166262 RepID=UPI003AB08C90